MHNIKKTAVALAIVLAGATSLSAETLRSNLAGVRAAGSSDMTDISARGSRKAVRAHRDQRQAWHPGAAAGFAAGTVVGGAAGLAFAPFGHDPYGSYAQSPQFTYGSRIVDGYPGYPVGYDSGGNAIFASELGHHPGPFSGAPANPCSLNLRELERC
jgi:hypothetical protein